MITIYGYSINVFLFFVIVNLILNARKTDINMYFVFIYIYWVYVYQYIIHLRKITLRRRSEWHLRHNYQMQIQWIKKWKYLPYRYYMYVQIHTEALWLSVTCIANRVISRFFWYHWIVIFYNFIQLYIDYWF